MLRAVTLRRNENPANYLMGLQNAKYTHKVLKIHRRKPFGLINFHQYHHGDTNICLLIQVRKLHYA